MTEDHPGSCQRRPADGPVPESKPTSPGADAEDARAIYEQDANFVRHHDSVKWSRFQTVSVVEGAALYACLQMNEGKLITIGLVLAATIIIGFIFVLAIVDSRIAQAHIARMRKLEAAQPLIFGNTLKPIFGFRTTRVAMSTILAFNLALIVWLACT